MLTPIKPDVLLANDPTRPLSPTPTIQTSDSTVARWLDDGTPKQKAALTVNQELEAWDVDQRIRQTEDWSALRDMAADLERSRGGTSAESLPNWVIDGFAARIRDRINVPLIGTVDQWATLSDRDRHAVWWLHSGIVSGNEFCQRASRHHHNLIVNGLEEADGQKLPGWAKRELLALCSERIPEALPPGPSKEHAPDRSTGAELTDVDDGNPYDAPPDAADVADNARSEESDNDPVTSSTILSTTVSTILAGASQTERFRVHLREHWAHGSWGAPTVCVHNALFSATKGDPGYYGATPGAVVKIPSLSHSRIFARGDRLLTWHLDLLMCLWDLAKNGDAIETTAKIILNEMKRGHSSADVRRLLTSLRQLAKTWVSLSFKPKNSHRWLEWSGTFIQHTDLADTVKAKGQVFRIVFDPALGHFFGPRWTYVEVADRAALRTNTVASALHLAYSQHVDDSIPYPLETVGKLLGISEKGKTLERSLVNSLLLLESRNLILGWAIDNGSLRVTPVMTPPKIAWLERNGRPLPIIVQTQPVAPAPAPSPPALADSLKPISTGVCSSEQAHSSWMSSRASRIARLIGQMLARLKNGWPKRRLAARSAE